MLFPRSVRLSSRFQLSVCQPHILKEKGLGKRSFLGALFQHVLDIVDFPLVGLDPMDFYLDSSLIHKFLKLLRD